MLSKHFHFLRFIRYPPPGCRDLFHQEKAVLKVELRVSEVLGGSFAAFLLIPKRFNRIRQRRFYRQKAYR